MELLDHLLWGNESLWGGGVAHSILILSLVITGGIMLGKIKIAGISLGVTGILFIGIAFGHFGLNVNEHLLHFLKEFGLILFVSPSVCKWVPDSLPHSEKAASP